MMTVSALQQISVCLAHAMQTRAPGKRGRIARRRRTLKRPPAKAFAFGYSKAVPRAAFIWKEYDMMKQAKAKAQRVVMNRFWKRHPAVKCYTHSLDIRDVSTMNYLRRRYKKDGTIQYVYRLAWTSAGCWADATINGQKQLHFYKIINPLLLSYLLKTDQDQRKTR